MSIITANTPVGIRNATLAPPPPSPFSPVYAQFDGVNQNLTHAASAGLVDTSDMTISFWYKPDTSTARDFLLNLTGRTQIEKTVARAIQVILYDAPGGNIIYNGVTSELVTLGVLNHVFISAQFLTSGSVVDVWINGVKDTNTPTVAPVDETPKNQIDNTTAGMAIGSTFSSALYVDGCLGEICIIDDAYYADTTSFATANSPIDLGSIGTNAKIYVPDPVDGLNLGTGNDFTVNNIPTRCTL